MAGRVLNTYKYLPGNRNVGAFKDDEEMWYEALDFCGCGDPGAAMQALFDLLEVFALADRSDRIARFNKLYPVSGQQWLMLYVLDKDELIEHGGAVSSGWLTEKGWKVFNTLEAVLEDADDDA